MGTWGTGIKENDYAADVYDEYFEHYDNGDKPVDITRGLIADNKDTIDGEGASDFWLPLALAQWETGSLTQQVIEQVTTIVASGSDLENWKELDASDEDISERKTVLNNFLEQIKHPNPHPMQPNQPKKISYPKIEIKMKPEDATKLWWKFW